jgi:hypothetical protein
MAHDEAGLVASSPDQVILESDSPRCLAYTWHTITPECATAVGMDAATAGNWRAEPRSKVAVDIEDVGHGTVKLAVTHDGFARAAGWSRPSPTGGPQSCRAQDPAEDRGVVA